MNNIPKAEELYYKFKGGNINISKKQFIEALKFYTKLHVQAALEAAKKESIEFHEGTTHLEEKIGRCYPLTNIK